MGFLQKIWNYISTGSRMKVEQAMDPSVEIEMTITEARRRDEQLRQQAAKVLAHRTMLERNIEDTTEQVARSRDLTKKALLKADEAQKSGDIPGSEKWTRTAQSLAMRLQAVESNLESLKQQYEFAVGQAEDAKRAVQLNATRVQELAARRLQLVGKLQQAKMQETVNRAMATMNATLGEPGPSMSEIENKINERLGTAEAHAELRAATPEGAEAELQEAISLTQADEKLEELRTELGLGHRVIELEPSTSKTPATPAKRRQKTPTRGS